MGRISPAPSRRYFGASRRRARRGCRRSSRGWPSALIDDLLGHSNTYRVAMGPRAGQKMFSLQAVPAGEEGPRKGVAQRERWVLRHYHRGALVARLIEDHYLLSGFLTDGTGPGACRGKNVARRARARRRSPRRHGAQHSLGHARRRVPRRLRQRSRATRRRVAASGHRSLAAFVAQSRAADRNRARPTGGPSSRWATRLQCPSTLSTRFAQRAANSGPRTRHRAIARRTEPQS
jgi:hypothetical protein